MLQGLIFFRLRRYTSVTAGVLKLWGAPPQGRWGATPGEVKRASQISTKIFIFASKHKIANCKRFVKNKASYFTRPFKFFGKFILNNAWKCRYLQ